MTDKLRQEWLEASHNKEIKQKEMGDVVSEFMDTEEYQNWLVIRNKIYDGDFENSWRVDYKTFDEALSAEGKLYELAMQTKEYKHIAVIDIELANAEELLAKSVRDYISAGASDGTRTRDL